MGVELLDVILATLNLIAIVLTFAIKAGHRAGIYIIRLALSVALLAGGIVTTKWILIILFGILSVINLVGLFTDEPEAEEEEEKSDYEPDTNSITQTPKKLVKCPHCGGPNFPDFPIIKVCIYCGEPLE